MQPSVPEGRFRVTLLAVIRTHIQTGGPVGSRTVSRLWNESLSPASIRNIMLDLEEEGYLEQPHTSAGRVPTDKAYRFYASQCDVHQLPSEQDQSLISTYLSGVDTMPEEVMLERTSRVLSLISDNLGVVVSEPISHTVLDHIHFVRLNDRRVRVVLVSGLSLVRDHFITMESDITQPELDRAANYLNENFRGWQIESIRTELVKRLAEERAVYDALLKDIQQLCSQGMLDENLPSEVFFEGASNLIGRPELADPARVRELLQALEEKENLVRLISECIRAQGDALQVVVGLPGKPPLLQSFAMIGTTYHLDGHGAGRLAIMGPARMNYERLIQAVGFIGRLLQRQELN